MQLTKFIVTCFGLLICASNSLGQTNENSISELQRVAEVLEKSANALGYRTVPGYRLADEWEAEAKKPLLKDHAHYTLFARIRTIRA